MSFAKISGVLSGIFGRKSLLTTSSDTWMPLMSRQPGLLLYGGSRAAISQRITPKLNTSAISVYFWLLMTSGAIHWYVPIFPVMMSAFRRVQPKSAILGLYPSSMRMFRLLTGDYLLRSRCSTGVGKECR